MYVCACACACEHVGVCVCVCIPRSEILPGEPPCVDMYVFAGDVVFAHKPEGDPRRRLEERKNTKKCMYIIYVCVCVCVCVYVYVCA